MINKISEIVDILLGIAFFIMISALFIYIGITRTQLTTKSFNKISFINNEIEKLSVLENINFPDEEELRYNIYKLVDPNLFDKYFFLYNYLWSYDYGIQYIPKIENLKKINSKNDDLVKLQKEKYFNRDSLKFKIKSLTKREDYLIDYDYIDTKNYRNYHIRPIPELTISNEVLLKLKTIKNVSFRSSEEFEQALRQTLGLETYKQFNSFIRAVIDSIAGWQKILFFSSIGFFNFLLIANQAINSKIKTKEKSLTENELDEGIIKAKQDISEQPEKVTPIWTLAYYTLQKYYNKNLSQINSIYKLSIAVMIMGFLLIVSILIASIYFKIVIKLDSIGIIAGIITEFIGATFLFIYKSTINQALQHSKSLEEINKVGMSIKIVESIELDDKNKSKIDDAKIEIAKKLITSNNDILP
jgi:hypothetical protein